MKFKLRAICVISLVFLPSVISAPAQNTRSVPPGIRHAQELQAENETIGPPNSVDTAALQRDAEQLASLAAAVPPGVQDANKGMLSKDLIPKLKQIEKLSKHLRNELSRR